MAYTKNDHLDTLFQATGDVLRQSEQLIPIPEHRVFLLRLDEQIQKLDKKKNDNIQKLAKALRDLRDTLDKDFFAQESSQTGLKKIRISTAMLTLKDTLVMLESIQTMDPPHAINAINLYKERCDSRSSIFPDIISSISLAAIGLVVGASIGLVASVCMGGFVNLPLIVAGMAALGLGISLILSGAALDKGFFRPQLDQDIDDVVHSSILCMRT
ncbi:hypothetical protein ACD661_15160 [Legionella lytica]|uniref:Inclusion membrane protein A n=1 Tax=Legionella lytica TaxID=96232 RepID=A0ABW8DB08_9GAMM